MAAVNRDVARAAKSRLAADLGSAPKVNGVGIAPVSDGYVLKVNLLEAAPELELPAEFDGVDVQVDVVGPGFPQIA